MRDEIEVERTKRAGRGKSETLERRMWNGHAAEVDGWNESLTASLRGVGSARSLLVLRSMRASSLMATGSTGIRVLPFSRHPIAKCLGVLKLQGFGVSLYLLIMFPNVSPLKSKIRMMQRG